VAWLRLGARAIGRRQVQVACRPSATPLSNECESLLISFAYLLRRGNDQPIKRAVHTREIAMRDAPYGHDSGPPAEQDRA